MLTASNASWQGALLLAMIGCGAAEGRAVEREPRADPGADPEPAERPSPVPVVPVLVEDFAFGSGDVLAVADGPHDLIAVANRAMVRIWDTSARVCVGWLPLDSEEDFAAVAFTGDDRIVTGIRSQLTIVPLRDLSRAQRLAVESPRRLEGTRDGVVVSYRDGRTIRYGGDPLTERFTWQLPAGDVSSIAAMDDRVFVTLGEQLFLLVEGESPRTIALPAGIGPVVASVGSESLVVTSRERMIALSLETLAPIRDSPAEPAAGWILDLDCVPVARACHRRRNLETTDVWRDDASERIETTQRIGIVDRRTGRVVRWGYPASALVVHDELNGEGRPMGGRLEIPSSPSWRANGELAVWLGDDGYVLRLSELALTEDPDLALESVITPDGREVIADAVGAKVVIVGARGEIEREIVIAGCDRRQLARLSGVDLNERDRERREDLERRCADLTPIPFAVAPRSSLVAMASGVGFLHILDYARGRWAAERPGPPREVHAMAWSPDELELSILAGDELFTLRNGRVEPSGLPRGIRAMARSEDGTLGLARGSTLHLHGASEHTIDVGLDIRWLFAGPSGEWIAVGDRRAALVREGALAAEHALGPGRSRWAAARWIGSQPFLVTSNERPALALTRMRDGRTLEVPIVHVGGRPYPIALDAERFFGAPEARTLVHRRADANDLLSARSSAEPAPDPSFVASFLRGE